MKKNQTKFMMGFKKFCSNFSPRFQPGTHIFVIRGSVISQVVLKVLVFGVWSTIITYISLNIKDLSIENALISVVGGFIALLLAFRANTAYDRFWEGSKLWCNMQTSLREIALVTWSSVDAPTEAELNEKKQILRATLAFAVATKHYLRYEHGGGYPDLKALLQPIPAFANRLDIPEKQVKKSKFNFFKSEPEGEIDCTLPLEISHFIISYFCFKLSTKQLRPGIFDRLRVYIDNLMTTLTSMERILTTPLPLAYSVHLSQSVWIFCTILPFQMLSMVQTDPWSVPPFMCLSTFILFGILSLSEEIENPFGYDYNDLPLDQICEELKYELEIIPNMPKV